MNLGNDLEAKIKTDRPDLEEINIELYRKDFFQENNVLINTVNSDKPEKRQGVWMDPQKKISQCFSLGEEDSASPFPLEEEEEEIDGRAFLKMTEQRFRDYGMKGGPAVKLVEFAKECKDKKLRSFSSYKTKKELSEVLEKYGIVSGDITRIPQFIPPIHTINESAPEFKLCIDDILRRIKNMGPVVDSNEAMRYLPKLTTMPKCLRYEYKYEQEKKKGG
ncbi:hypothetical protein GLOIN_2v1734289 [Rhizophagus irregularis DAOM 181602=DAOM 197198]|nr:hypothetical protein GLOIN_2v1734289 [Rhizophagus irregularis DAOM 181602=DAOM 197198]